MDLQAKHGQFKAENQCPLQQAEVLTPVNQSPDVMLGWFIGWSTAKSAEWLVPADPSTPPGAIAAVAATAWTGCALLAA